MYQSTKEAYQAGLSDTDRFLPIEVRQACENWRAAQYDHAETSYWGAAHIRRMRAFWIGKRRGSRENWKREGFVHNV